MCHPVPPSLRLPAPYCSPPKASKQEEDGVTQSSSRDESPLSAAHRLRQSITLEGAPLWGFLGTLEWFMVFVGLLALFTLQYLPGAGSLSQLAVRYWLFAAGGYTALVLVHGEK